MGLLRFVCQFCDKAFGSKQKWEEHERTHTGDKPYECKYCGRRFAHELACKSHEIRHSGVKPFACGLCDYKCYQQSELKRHSKQHEGMNSNKESITSTMLTVTAHSCTRAVWSFVVQALGIDYLIWCPYTFLAIF